ncbi:MAG: glycosyltransferase family 4 protein [Anaerolineaceae bacterium]|nr:glycosyltransferase family 4 protein [Anaerolineaceae bacterium]
MHILIIHQAFATLTEGGGTRHYEFSRYLVQNGHNVTIITSPISYLTGVSTVHQKKFKIIEQPEPGMTIIKSYAYPALHKSFVHRVINFISFMLSSFLAGLSVKDVDLVWGTSPPIFQSGAAWLIAKFKRIPFLFEVRDLWPAFAIEMGVLTNPLLIKPAQWFEKLMYRQADRVMVNSPGYIEHVSQRGAKRVELIPNGGEPAMFSEKADGLAFRKSHQLEGKFLILYAGAHGLANDLDILIQAADQVRDHKHIHFVFIGDGKEKENLINHAEQLKLDNVTFLSTCSKEEIVDVISAANVCAAILQPIPLFKTTFPNKVFDYLVAEKPVLLAIDGVIRQVVEDANAGFFVEPGDPNVMAKTILEISQSPDKLILMGKSGRNYVAKHYNRKDIADKLAILIEDMVKEK